MATKTKSTTTKSTTAKSTTNKPKPKKDEKEFYKAYARFRTVLDGLEITALRYCLKDADPAKRIKRAKEVEKKIMPIITELQNKLNPTANTLCPEGFYNCGGCCVPYQCPDERGTNKK